MRIITARIVAEKLSAYLGGKLKLTELVDWAEDAMMDGEFEEQNLAALREIVGRLGVADMKAFGLTWEDCQRFLNQLGYAVRVEVIAAN